VLAANGWDALSVCLSALVLSGRHDDLARLIAAWEAISPDDKQTILAVVDAELEAANAR
jgi:hypothetical protein